MKKTLFIAMFIVAALVLVSGQSYAVTGHCANCHTMHNSQNGASVNGNVDGNPVLLKWTCLGCHTTTTTNQNEGSIPRVAHYGTTDLAGGNFNYVGGNQTKGHNVVGVVTQSGTIAADTLIGKAGVPAPGGSQVVPVTCAGTNGCHGLQNGTNEMASVSGAHHSNNTTVEADASDLGKSYRFLSGVKGAEVANRENSSASNHNEYFSDASAGISKILCGRCHSDFHNKNGIEGTGAWTRHPIDFALNGGNNLAGNYGANGGANTYDYTVPVGRTGTAPAAISDAANAGDTVMCLSCHKAHGTDYPDMLRWDYANIRAGENNTEGCNKCHAK